MEREEETMNGSDASAPEGAPVRDERSIATLLRDLSEDSLRLIKQEAQLFRAETEHRIALAQHRLMVIGAGGLTALLGVMALVASAVLALSEHMPAWAAALLIGGALLSAGTVAAVIGKRKLDAGTLVLHESKVSVARDVRAVAEAVR